MPATQWVEMRHKQPSTDGFVAGIVSGEFTVEDYCVTEDAAHNIYVGYTTKFDRHSEGTYFGFEVDRSGSADTATWWNDRVRADESTFDHTADRLNFAIKGTMKLTFYKQDGSAILLDKIYNNVFLAQGHSGLTNNWWVAATGAVQTGVNGHIYVQDTMGAKTIFKRGGEGEAGDQNWTNNIFVNW